MTHPNVQPLIDLDGMPGITAYYCKGHVDPNDFAKEILEQWGDDVDLTKIEHLYLRWAIFAGPDGWERCAYDYRAPGRGRFKATFYNKGFHG